MDAPPVVGGSSPPTWGIRLDSSTAFLKCGSSPHTWGIHRVRGQERAERRFIPTYVGHTRPRSRYHPHPPVHPHIRGAYACWRVLIVPASRFIPTYVGHTTLCKCPSPLVAVHPHIRGAYLVTDNNGAAKVGSSPHTWGIQPEGCNVIIHRRFIPTYVGHTAKSGADC